MISIAYYFSVMASNVSMPAEGQPKSMKRPSHWSEEVEEAYRFQLAGYRDEIEYREFQKTDKVSNVYHTFLFLFISSYK